MIGLLRFTGIVNAALWFGASLYFTFAVGPVLFSGDMLALFGASKSEPLARYYAGSAALILFRPYFLMQHWCGAIALLYLLAEWLLTGRPLQRLSLVLTLSVFCLGLAGGFWLQPHMQQWHRIKYGLAGQTSPDQVQQAERSFRLWHGISQAANLLVLAGVTVLLWRISQASPSSRLAGRPKYHLE